jgi:predicted  nucleic acid-binding Zn-ribbon protein
MASSLDIERLLTRFSDLQKRKMGLESQIGFTENEIQSIEHDIGNHLQKLDSMKKTIHQIHQEISFETKRSKLLQTELEQLKALNSRLKTNSNSNHLKLKELQDKYKNDHEIFASNVQETLQYFSQRIHDNL